MLIEQIILITMCIIGVGITSHNIGVRTGAAAMFDSMCELGDREGNTIKIEVEVTDG
jgi:hypothetical protein